MYLGQAPGQARLFDAGQRAGIAGPATKVAISGRASAGPTLQPSRTPNGGSLRLSAETSSPFSNDGARYAAQRRSQPLDLQLLQAFPEGNGSLPDALYRLLDPAASVELPPPGSTGAPRLTAADNRELDKLVAALGRNKATWRRALLLHEWLLACGHRPDDRLCTTLIRVCAQHGQAASALAVYDWMRAPVQAGGGGLPCTVFTFTAAMRAALAGGMPDRALAVWEDAVADRCDVDCRLCTTLIEACARRGDTDRALETYERMRAAPPDSKLAPTVHAYTAAMRAAAEGGRWAEALSIWDDMERAGCKPTGHAYAAVISACAAGGQWQRAVGLFDEMLGWGIKPDVVSCTALISALGAEGQWERAEKVVEWMLRSDIRPNVRTYTALIAALGAGGQWERALEVVQRMRRHAYGAGIEPNAYTYSALLKSMGEQGRWQLAEGLFAELEREQLVLMAREAQLAAAQQLTAGLAGGVPAAGAEAAQHASGSSACSLLSGGGGGISEASFELSAFPGMRKTVALDLPPAAAGSAPQADAVAAAAAAVAAVAAAHQQQALAGGAEAGGAGLLQQLLLQSAAASAVAEDAAPAAAAPARPASSALTSPAFSYFSSLFAAPAAAGPVACAAGKAGAAPSSPDSVAAAAAAWASPAGAVAAAPAPSDASAAWTNDNAAVRGLSLSLADLSAADAALAPWAAAAPAAAAGVTPALRSLPKGKGPVNEVVCGALMLAYERAGKAAECAAVLDRARALGISPNTVMYNTAISALGKAQLVDAAAALFAACPAPDGVTFETMIAAYGMAGRAAEAEDTFQAMVGAGFAPRDYAYCGLIAAHSFAGEWRAAQRVRERMAAAGAPATVHTFNALIAACDRAQQYDAALRLHREMKDAGVAPNAVTQSLLEGVCKEGVRAVEKQQAAATALSAAVAAAGAVLMRAGVF